MTIFRVLDGDSVVLETDDWIDAEIAAGPRNWRTPRSPRRIAGTDPSHDWDTQNPRRCRSCQGWDNGSFGSHAPCGYVFDAALVTIIERELAKHAATPPAPVLRPEAGE